LSIKENVNKEWSLLLSFQPLTDNTLQNWISCLIILFDNKVRLGGFRLSENEVNELEIAYSKIKKNLSGKSRYEQRNSNEGQRLQAIREVLKTPAKLQGRPGLPTEFSYLLLAGLEQTKNTKGLKVHLDTFYELLKNGLSCQSFKGLLDYDELPEKHKLSREYKQGELELDKYDSYNDFKRKLLFSELHQRIPLGHIGRSEWRKSIRLSCLNAIAYPDSSKEQYISNSKLTDEELKWLKKIDFSKPRLVQSDIELLIMKRKGLISYPIFH